MNKTKEKMIKEVLENLKDIPPPQKKNVWKKK